MTTDEARVIIEEAHTAIRAGHIGTAEWLRLSAALIGAVADLAAQLDAAAAPDVESKPRGKKPKE